MEDDAVRNVGKRERSGGGKGMDDWVEVQQRCGGGRGQQWGRGQGLSIILYYIIILAYEILK